ncbi:hypothetical protein [Corynebacterium stationis]|uniref:hypothetical protein n=1 Tax=Corynebacterium stationis TaxID=1705 RepID=UPI00076F7D7B|nr:hypothetical protein [Corynebacterium stationis]AMJ44235.1 hypothetical protein AW169_04435 [Corynebacterium stationis]AQX70694.1 hypothetical protein CA21670_03615 [Corynebacterium stationis]ASJ18383.1 hypothetical protein BA700_04435 [Corynebacterium stationis]HJG63473.1 hypothetical protein [Corynebacterium stationis]
MTALEQYAKDLAAAGITLPAEADKFTTGYDNRIEIQFGSRWSWDKVAEYKQELQPLEHSGYKVQSFNRGLRIDLPKPEAANRAQVINSVSDVTKELRSPCSVWNKCGNATGKGVTVKLGQIAGLDQDRFTTDLTALEAKGFRVYKNANAMGETVAVTVEPPLPQAKPANVIDALQQSLGLNAVNGGWVSTGKVSESGQCIEFEPGKNNGYFHALEFTSLATRNGWVVNRTDGHVQRISFTAPAGLLP